MSRHETLAESDLRDSSTGRVAMALLAFGGEGERGELSVTDVARRIGRERSQVSRMLKVLASAGLLEQNPATRGYRLGWQVRLLATRAGDHRLLIAAEPALRELVALTKETALLSVLQGNRSFTVARERSPQSVQAGGWVGRTSPLHAAASGRALIFSMTDEEVTSLIRDDVGQPGLGPKAPASVRAVLHILRRERAQGYTVAIDQLEDGLASVSVPVLDSARRIIASINVSGPTSRLKPHVHEVAKIVTDRASRVSLRMRQPLP